MLFLASAAAWARDSAVGGGMGTLRRRAFWASGVGTSECGEDRMALEMGLRCYKAQDAKCRGTRLAQVDTHMSLPKRRKGD